jgi:hypothetical protein
MAARCKLLCPLPAPPTPLPGASRSRATAGLRRVREGRAVAPRPPQRPTPLPLAFSPLPFPSAPFALTVTPRSVRRPQPGGTRLPTSVVERKSSTPCIGKDLVQVGTVL